MKFNALKHQKLHKIENKDDFDLSIFAEIDTKLGIDWTKLVFIFDDKYEEDLDEVHELYYFLEGSATHLEVINENVNLYEVDDMKFVLIDFADGCIGIGIDRENKSNFDKMY